MTEKFVTVFPAVVHLHMDGRIVTVMLRRRNGRHVAECPGCDTRFVYRKPLPSRQKSGRSAALPKQVRS